MASDPRQDSVTGLGGDRHREVVHRPRRRVVSALFGIVAAIGIGCAPDQRHLTIQAAEAWPTPARARLDFAYVLSGLLLDGWPPWEIEDIAAATSEALALSDEPSLTRVGSDDIRQWFTEVRCSELRLDRDCEGAAPAYCEDDAPTGERALTPVATARRGVWRVRAFELGECPREVLDGEV